MTNTSTQAWPSQATQPAAPSTQAASVTATQQNPLPGTQAAPGTPLYARQQTRRKLSAAHPDNTEPKRCYRILRGQYTRREYATGDKKGAFVHYAAGTSRDTLEMTDAESERFGRKFLVEVTSGGLEKPTQEQVAYVESQKRVSARVGAKGKEVA